MEKMNFIVDLVVTRHLTTFTHSVMVSYLAEAIGKHILAARPELLRIPSSYLEGNAYASPAEYWTISFPRLYSTISEKTA